MLSRTFCLSVLLALLNTAQIPSDRDLPKDGISLETTEYLGLDCFRIETPHAVFILDKEGVGLASMLDRDGNDWLGFSPTAGTGAEGEYRGFPNAVFREAGNYFHARNQDTDPSECRIAEANDERVIIECRSGNGLWGATYTFTAAGCTFTMTKMPEGHAYWVLYEGTPGGEYDDSDWWMTSAAAQKHPLTENHNGDIADVEWIAFGDRGLRRALVLHHLEDDEHPDRFYQMAKKMTVFGFGRAGMDKFLKTVPQSFRISFVESDQYEVIKEAVESESNSQVERQEDNGAVVDDYVQFALRSDGDAEAGKKLFTDPRTKCATCHRIGNEGGEVGPNLSRIGNKFDRPHLIDSLLYPSRQIGYGYETTIVLGVDGTTTVGIAKEASDSHIRLVNSENKSIRIARDDIEQAKIDPISIMPNGLADQLSKQEFVDLISYLESLGSGNGKFGSGISGPISLPEGFRLTTVATGLSGAVAMEIAPDGSILVCEQDGTLKRIREQSDAPNSEAEIFDWVKIPVELNWERGLIGVTLDPNFPEEPFVYVVYVTDEPYTHHRISRFRVAGDQVVEGSEEILFKGDDQSKFGGNVPAGHQGGGIHFGPDGKLFVGLGEQTAGTPAQSLEALQGKILRINRDGSIPSDNPFVKQTTGKYQAIWAIGCRNPFTFAFRDDGLMLINDVGGKFEEINQGLAGANYGWPNVDHGPTDQAGVTGPVHIYRQSSINGGDFCQSASWPNDFKTKYFFADFVQGWVKFIDPDSPKDSSIFLDGIRRPVDLRFAPNGDLYVLLRNAWVVDKKFEGGTGALVKISYGK